MQFDTDLKDRIAASGVMLEKPIANGVESACRHRFDPAPVTRSGLRVSIPVLAHLAPEVGPRRALLRFRDLLTYPPLASIAAWGEVATRNACSLMTNLDAALYAALVSSQRCQGVHTDFLSGRRMVSNPASLHTIVVHTGIG